MIHHQREKASSIFKQSSPNLTVCELRHKFVTQFVRENKIKSLLDLGCNQCQLIQKIQRQIEVQLIVGLDICKNTLQIAKSIFLRRNPPKQEIFERQKDQQIKLYHGSALNKYKELKYMNFELITLIQVIQHLQLDKINELNQNIFGYLNPENVIISTPNKDFNHLFKWFNGTNMRHEDHKFQWTRAEFENYAKNVSCKYNYSYTISGVGQHITDHTKGFSTQIATFRKKQLKHSNFKIKLQNDLKLVYQLSIKCWKTMLQQLIKPEIQNSLLHFKNRVNWENGIKYFQKTKIFKLMDRKQQSGQIPTIKTKKMFIQIFKTMQSSISWNQFGYQRRRQKDLYYNREYEENVQQSMNQNDLSLTPSMHSSYSCFKLNQCQIYSYNSQLPSQIQFSDYQQSRGTMKQQLNNSILQQIKKPIDQSQTVYKFKRQKQKKGKRKDSGNNLID